MKHIGFIDYYISEWHANNYPAWFKDANEKLGLDYKVAYAWAEIDTSPVSGETTDEWCSRMGVERCSSIAELCDKSDVVLILAPSNPEKHLDYAKEVLSYGKRTYIDKTFAPNTQIAKEIFKIAEEYGTLFFSSSALRYSEELVEFTDVRNVILTGSGRSLEEYVIHLIEMTVSLLKSSVKKVKVDHIGKQRVCNMVAENGAKAAVIYSPALAYSITVENSKGEIVHKKIESSFFFNLITDILNFFEHGVVSFDVRETLEVIRVRDGILEADKKEGEWLELY